MFEGLAVVAVKVRGGKKAVKRLRKTAKDFRGGFKLGYPKAKSGNANYPDGTSVIDVAFYNEFGHETRDGSYFVLPRPSLARGAKRYVKEGKKNRKRIIKGIGQGKIKTKKALGLMGAEARSNIQKEIVDLSDPPNAPSTIKAKKSTNPLVDTGLMRQTINYEVF